MICLYFEASSSQNICPFAYAGIVKAMVVRLSETSRINERDIQRLEKRSTALLRDKKVAQDQQNLEKVPEFEGKLIEGYRDIDNAKVVIENVMGLLRWLCEELFDNMYPGTVFEREVTALELLHCAIDSTCDNVAMRNIFFSPSMTTTMLNLLLSSWDKSRRLAADLLFKFPRPLPCYTTSKDLIPLVDRGCKLGENICILFSDCASTDSSMTC